MNPPPPQFGTVLEKILIVTAESLAVARGYRALLLAGIEPTSEATFDWVARHPEAFSTRRECGRDRGALAGVPPDIMAMREWSLRPHGRLRACVHTLRSIRELAEEEERSLQDVQPNTLRRGSEALEQMYNVLDEIRTSRKWPARLP